MKLVDLKNKPEWFLKINPEDRVPAVNLDEKWVADSDVITQALKEKFLSPPLGTPPEKAIFSRDSFVKTRAQPRDVIEGWRPKVEG